MGKGRILLVREDGGDKMLGIGLELNEYQGFTKLRLLENDEDTEMEVGPTQSGETANMRATLRVECVPSFWCVRVGYFDLDVVGEAFDIEVPEEIFEIEWSAVERAMNRNLTRVRLPQPGTLEYVLRSSSSRPSDNYDRELFEVKTSELCTKGHVTDTFVGLFAKQPLRESYCIGEYLGERFRELTGREESRYLFAVYEKPTHMDNGRPRTISGKNDVLEYIDASDPETSSFLRFVNAPTVDEELLTPEESETLRLDASHLLTDRPGWANASFVQIEDRIFLMTTAPVPAGKEVLASYGAAFPLPMNKVKIMRASREWLRSRQAIVDTVPLPVKKKAKKAAVKADKKPAAKPSPAASKSVATPVAKKAASKAASKPAAKKATPRKSAGGKRKADEAAATPEPAESTPAKKGRTSTAKSSASKK
eukprot:TRINITY_DN8561_c0_g1_i1.p1 TRINITY_DN8561_c0_g1~~TRINITY_DN8561_c0_g1_i1.p1  ORF type:complete len:440 (+),score=181.78 TRINITY_DN8561_c0_g1_i1:54-1322(+)